MSVLFRSTSLWSCVLLGDGQTTLTTWWGRYLGPNSPELKILLHVFTLHLLHCASIIVCPTGRIFPCCFLPVLQITTYSQPWGSIAPSYEFQASVFTFSTMLGFAIIFLPSSFAQSAVSDRAVSLNAKYMYVY